MQIHIRLQIPTTLFGIADPGQKATTEAVGSESTRFAIIPASFENIIIALQNQSIPF